MPWELLESFGFRHEAFNEQHNIYYRSTRHTERVNWLPAKFIWCLKRDYGDNPKDNIECCIQLMFDGKPHYWFIWNNKAGFDSLVVEPKLAIPND